jgi:hypothetical protein
MYGGKSSCSGAVFFLFLTFLTSAKKLKLLQGAGGWTVGKMRFCTVFHLFAKSFSCTRKDLKCSVLTFLWHASELFSVKPLNEYGTVLLLRLHD